MKKYKFTLGERYRMMVTLNEFKGNLETLSSLIDDVKNIKIDEVEWEKADRKITVSKNENGQDVNQWNWNDEKGGEKEMELNKETVKYLSEVIDKKDKDNEITLADITLISLKNKLK